MRSVVARTPLRRLIADTRAVALVEFAFTLPLFLLLALTAAELTNFITTKMRLSQLALHIADNASRMGSGSLLAAKTISEAQINDVLTGAGYESGELNLYTNGRVVLSDVEPVANPNTNSKYKIVWQRCRGSQTYTPAYGVAGATNLDGMGPAGQKVTAPDDSATMFVEIFYNYQPLIVPRYAPAMTISEIAAMTVRDRRDLSGGTNGIYNTEGATVSSC